MPEVVWFGPAGEVQQREMGDVPELLRAGAGWVWVDIPEPDEQAGAFLQEVFRFHPRAVSDCLERNHVSRLHAYRDTLFLVLHKPEPGEQGHVHYLELDQFIAPGYLVTVHGPRNPMVPLDAMLRETRDVAARIRAGRLVPASPYALSYAIVSALTNVEEGQVNRLAEQVGALEQRVMRNEEGASPQAFLEELFRVRHALVTVHTMSAQAGQVYGRAARLMVDTPMETQRVLGDLKDQYERVARISQSQLDFLAGVTDFYRARTDTKMTIAAERLAVIAAVTLPVTAISSVLGMNVIVNGETDPRWLTGLVVVMGALSIWLLRWARRQGWW